MCDYSLELVASRPAKVGDQLVSIGFHQTMTRGFASVDDPNVAVCLLPGTELAFEDEVRCETGIVLSLSFGYRVASFRQINKDQSNRHRDALELPDGKIVLLTHLCRGRERRYCNYRQARRSKSKLSNRRMRSSCSAWDFAVAGAELKAMWGPLTPSASAIGLSSAIRCRAANIVACVRRPVVGIALTLVAISLPDWPSLAEDANALMGRWLVPSREQAKSRISPQCQQYAEADVQTIPESEIEIFSCDDPAFAPQKTRILEFVKSVNEVYRAQKGRSTPRPSLGYARSYERRRRNGRPIFAIRAKSSAELHSKICRSSGIYANRETRNGRWWVIAIRPRRDTGLSPVSRSLPPTGHNEGMPPLGRRAAGDWCPDMRLRMPEGVRGRCLDPKIIIEQ